MGRHMSLAGMSTGHSSGSKGCLATGGLQKNAASVTARSNCSKPHRTSQLLRLSRDACCYCLGRVVTQHLNPVSYGKCEARAIAAPSQRGFQ